MTTIRYLPLTTAVALSLFAAAATAESSGQTVEVYKFGTDAGETTVKLDSDVMGFHLHELADGDSRVVTTEAGQVVSLTRSGATLNIAVDGNDFDVPFRPAGLPGVATGERTVKKIVVAKDSDAHSGLMILSGEPIDAATRDTIRAALSAAGIDQPVHFADGDVDIEIEATHELHDTHDGEERKHIVIKKKSSTD